VAYFKFDRIVFRYIRDQTKEAHKTGRNMNKSKKPERIQRLGLMVAIMQLLKIILELIRER
jgi:hypothetical protein